MSSAPRFAPSSLNWTPATPLVSVAVAVTAVEPETVEPPAGAVIAATGPTVSGGGLLTVTVTVVAVLVLFSVSRATAVSVCEPLVALVVFQLAE